MRKKYTKLSDEQLQMIKQEVIEGTFNQGEIAKRYNTTQTSVSRIKRNPKIRPLYEEPVFAPKPTAKFTKQRPVTIPSVATTQLATAQEELGTALLKIQELEEKIKNLLDEQREFDNRFKAERDFVDKLTIENTRLTQENYELKQSIVDLVLSAGKEKSK